MQFWRGITDAMVLVRDPCLSMNKEVSLYASKVGGMNYAQVFAGLIHVRMSIRLPNLLSFRLKLFDLLVN